MILAALLAACVNGASDPQQTAALIKFQGSLACLSSLDTGAGEEREFLATVFVHFDVADHEVCELDGFTQICEMRTEDYLKNEIAFDPDFNDGSFLFNTAENAEIQHQIDHPASYVPSIIDLDVYITQVNYPVLGNAQYTRAGSYNLSDLATAQQEQILAELNETYRRQQAGESTPSVQIDLGDLTGLCD